jgi:putative hydrolase of HD superfamily
MNIDAILHFLMTANQLKSLPRTGWNQRGVPNPESISAHSFHTVLVAMVLLELTDEPLDTARVLAMAALHDVPEAITGDIPSPAKRFFPDGSGSLKKDIERAVMRSMSAETPFQSDWMALWEEMTARQTRESQLVRDADKLELYLQAYLYEHQTGSQALAEFWTTPHRFTFAAAQAIYDRLRNSRLCRRFAPRCSRCIWVHSAP